MKKIILIALFTCICIQSYGQNLQSKWEQTRPIELEIENYISNHIDTFKFSKEELQSLEHNHENLKTENVLTVGYLNQLKRKRLRAQYFSENPETIELYTATKAARQNNCTSADFESGINTNLYTFYSGDSAGHPGGDNYNLDININVGIVTPFVPSPALNNFGNVSLVSPGNVSDYLGLDTPIPVDAVFNGSRALRINPRNGFNDPNDFEDIGDVTVVERSFTMIDEPTLSLNMSLLLDEPNHNNHPFVRFEMVDASGNANALRVITSNDLDGILIDAPNSNWKYTNWSCLNLSVCEYVGQAATLRIIVSDCSAFAHDAILYIDDICNNGDTCTSSPYGGISVCEEQETCPEAPFQICGEYTAPLNAVGNPSITLAIEDANGDRTPLYTNTFANGQFCFMVDPEDFGLSGVQNLEIINTATFTTTSGNTIEVEDSSAFSGGPDIVFNLSCLPPYVADVTIDGIAENCPDSRAKVNGTYLVPDGGTLENIVLEIYQGDSSLSPVTTVLAPDELTTSTYCFYIDVEELGTSLIPGNYYFNTIAYFNIDGYTVSESASPNLVVNSRQLPYDPCEDTSCPVITEAEMLNNWTLGWENIPNATYTLSFEVDYSCVPDGVSYTLDGNTATITTTNNYLPLQQVNSITGGRVWKYRIRVNNCAWTEWCCIAAWGYIDPSCSSTAGNLTGEDESTPIEKLADITVYPNPASDNVTVKTNENISSISLLNLQGSELDHLKVISKNQITLPVVDYKTGMYILRIVLEDGTILHRNIVIK